MIFEHSEIGCYADGTFGHVHVRSKLANLIESFDPKLAESLQGEMPDDAWDEDEALEILQKETHDDLTWVFDSGDLLLVENKEYFDV